MNTINSNKLGLALGSTGVLFYLGCMLLMLIAGKEGTTWFFNSILHGLDVTNVAQMGVPIGQTVTGIIITFVLGWLGGYLVGTIYNWKIK